MSYEVVPVGLRALDAGRVAIHLSPRAAELLGDCAGWQVLSRKAARLLADACESRGRADRRDPMAPGARIALQGLGRQIRHRLEKSGAKGRK